MKVLHLENNNDLIEYLNSDKNINDEKSAYEKSPNFTSEHDHVLIKVSDLYSNVYTNPKYNVNQYTIGNISLFIYSNKVKLKKKIINLSKKEHEILFLLMKSYPRITKKEVICTKIWNKNHSSMSNTLEVHLNRLRKKLGKNKITCIKGFGYKLNI